MKVRIINKSKNLNPQYQTEGSAGMDLCANIEEPIEILPGQRVIIPTGLFIELPIGYEAQIRPRSGMAYKNGISVPNAPGTIDADYRGEIKVILINLSDLPFCIADGDRIAQMVIAKYERVEWEDSDSLSETERSDGGFGSTGK